MKALTANQQAIVDLMKKGWLMRSNQVYGNCSLFNPADKTKRKSLDNRVVNGLHLRHLLKVHTEGFPASTYTLR